MKVSIITVTYNSAATLEQTILSVARQTYKDIEFIIIDGGSSDDTLKIIDQHKTSIAKIVSEKDNGLYDAINKGIDLATGDIIGILHSDDFYINEDVIKKYVAVFKEKQCDAVYSDLYYVDKNNTDKIVRKWKSGLLKNNSFLNGWMPPHPTFFVKRDLYQRLGKYSTAFRTAADYELMLRFIYRHKIHVAYLPEYTVKMRTGGKSNVTVHSRVNANLEDRKAWEMNGLKPRFYTLYLKPLRKILQFF
ncbi:MAG: glycosyltransferase [Bacteroidetes bacterium]|nr:glycosyltransferase [Bacteroidota bacterium]